MTGVLGLGLRALGATLITAAGIGAVIQAVATARDEAKYPPPGRLVDVGGHRLHVQVLGEGNTGPTALLEAGLDSFSTNWYWVQKDLATSMRVVAYDRAGLGWSEPGPTPRDARRSAEELHSALERLGVMGPYIVAGHSYGGLVVRMFADLYAGEVAGMVLVDASHPNQWAHIPASLGGRTPAASNRVLAALAWLGVLRLYDFLTPQIATGLPAHEYAQMHARFALPRSSAVGADTLDVWDSMTRAQVNQAHSLGPLPLIVLGVSEQPIYGETLTALQAELPQLSSNGTLRIVQHATHENLISNPEHAQIVADAVREVAMHAPTRLSA